MNLFIWCQYSNYDRNGIFSLHNDSGWNMMSGRFRSFFNAIPNLKIYVNVPHVDQRKETDSELFKHVKNEFDNRRIIGMPYMSPNHAFKIRYHFDYNEWEDQFGLLNRLGDGLPDAIICNDPLMVKNFKTLFKVSFNKNVPIVSYNHFIDNPSEPKVPKEVQYWYAQVAGALAADLNAFTCRSTFDAFYKDLPIDFTQKVFTELMAKSTVWDDGFSMGDVQDKWDVDLDAKLLQHNEALIFFPNRISQYADYTNSQVFIKAINELYKIRQDFSVIFGNPSQKTSNKEIAAMCPNTLILSDTEFKREQYRAILKNIDIHAGLYFDDKYGGCSWRECAYAGSLPISPSVYEYKWHGEAIGYPYLCKPDFSDLVSQLSNLIDCVSHRPEEASMLSDKLKDRVIRECSYEHTINKLIIDLKSICSF